MFLLGLGLASAPPLQGQAGGDLSGAPVGTARDSLAVERLLDSLPLRAKVAQLVMPWIAGSYQAFDDSAFAVLQGWVDSLAVGGIIVSIGSPTDVALRLNRLQRRSGLPLLIASDLESGAAFRLTGATPFPPNMGVGAAARDSDAFEVGRITALEGRAVGIHLAFAPVADVNNNPANPIINTRSFGEDSYLVARLVSASIQGLQQHGMLATAKHFPGHGDTETDSHLTLPLIPTPWGRLDTLELIPFRAAVSAGVALIMSAHVAMPAIGGSRERPATLDPAAMQGVLRDSLGFRGLVVTDALDMGGIVNKYGAGEAAVLAFLAGADLLLQPADPRAAIDAVTDAIETGRVTYDRLDRSVRRVLLLKRQLGLFRRREVPLDSVPETVGSRRFLAYARDLSTRSIVLAGDPAGVVDSLRAGPRSIALVTYGEENAGSVGNTLARQLRATGHRVTLFRLWPASGRAGLDSARAIVRKHPYTVFAASVRVSAWKGSVGLPDPVADLMSETFRRRRTVLVSLGSPYIGMQVDPLGAYLLAWTANGLGEWAAGRALTGQGPITGRLPVRIPPTFPLGAGLDRAATREP
ncbi:MAG: glycoside hydrolase family 3 N-terminal domain-containing protein [Gemmatimonadota bacterium]|nr:glycoside hydrolase family 3 N-terminal domain-containing protein [Gemmatimonadota bacterium]